MIGEPVRLSAYKGHCEIIGEGSAWVPEGLYELAFVQWRTARIFNRGKLILVFRVISPGKYFDTALCRYYNVELVGAPGKYGRFKARRSSDFVREYAALFGAAHRIDRISMRPLESVIVQGRTRVVCHARGRKIPESARYSVVAELVRVEAGSWKKSPGRG